MKKLSIIIIIFVALISCNNETTQHKLEEIKTLQTQVDSTKKVFNTLDFEKIAEMKAYAKQQLDFLDKHNKDTTRANAKYIDVYYANFKLTRKFVKGYERLESEIDFSTSQLTHLYNDVENGFANDSNYVKHFKDEKTAVFKIVNTCATLVDWQMRSTKRYNGMVQPIDSIITELKKQGFR
jgi:uncharacterized membrane-anchored protein YhcB (DUF1043 family)